MCRYLAHFWLDQHLAEYHAKKVACHLTRLSLRSVDCRLKDVNTDSDAWKLAMAACMDECGLPASFFESASNLILAENMVGWNVMKSGSSENSPMTDVEAVCVQQMRRYLLEHFDAR